MGSKLIQTEKLKKFYLKILNNLDFGIIIIDKNYNVKFINKFLKKFLKINNNITEKNLFKIFKDKQFSNELKNSIKINQKHKLNTQPYEIATKLAINNKYKHIKIKVFGTLFEEEEEEEEEVLITVVDITEIEELNKSLILAGKFSTLGTLASGLAHEIKNPLTVIDGHIYLLKNKNAICNDKFCNQSITVISQQSNRIQNIVNRLLNFAKESDTEKFKINLNTIIKRTVDMCIPIAVKKEIKIINRINEDIFICGIKMELEELFLNLLLNSIDAITHNRGEIIVSKIHQDEEKLIIAIIDNGKGIDNSIIDKIFDPFFTTKNSGTGLGLSICYKIMQNHNGAIRIISEPEVGTEIILKFPLKKENKND